MLKITGCILIIASSSAFGFLKACELNKKIYFFEKIKSLLINLRGEISYSKTPMAEAFFAMAERYEGELKQFCTTIAEEILKYDGRGFAEIWSFSIEQLFSKIVLEKKDKNELLNIGEKIANQDYDMQIASINREIEYFEENIAELKENIFQKQRIYRVLGIFFGLMVSVILI